MKIEDNFLDQEKFDELQALMLSDDFAWYYNNVVDTIKDVDKFQFFHIFYRDNSVCTFYRYNAPTSNFIDQLNPILEKMGEDLCLNRIKANLLTKTSNIIENRFHADLGFMSEEKQKQWTTSIFYINTNNGYTEFEDGTKVESVANRMITFPTNLKHRGTSCTDEKTRMVINFNYFDMGINK